MKWLYIITLAILCLGVNRNTYAEIKNGYEEEVRKTERYINNLLKIAEEVLSTAQREKLNTCLKVAYAKQEKLIENHAKTRELIEMFRIVDPDLYQEINTIQNREGNLTQVYVKVVSDLKGDLQGGTNLNQTDENPHVYTSEYGDYTVSVRVTFPSLEKALRILVHELGHVRYQVPHLAAYTIYYKQAYQDNKIIGHHDKDPSHLAVKATMYAFIDTWRENKTAMRGMTRNEYRKMLATFRAD